MISSKEFDTQSHGMHVWHTFFKLNCNRNIINGNINKKTTADMLFGLYEDINNQNSKQCTNH